MQETLQNRAATVNKWQKTNRWQGIESDVPLLKFVIAAQMVRESAPWLPISNRHDSNETVTQKALPNMTNVKRISDRNIHSHVLPDTQDRL